MMNPSVWREGEFAACFSFDFFTNYCNSLFCTTILSFLNCQGTPVNYSQSQACALPEEFRRSTPPWFNATGSCRHHQQSDSAPKIHADTSADVKLPEK